MRKKWSLKERVLALTKQEKKKGFRHAIIAVILCIVLIAVIRIAEPPAESSTDTVSSESVFSAAMVGDMMMGRHVEEVASRNGYESLFQYTGDLFKQVDYMTGNFENPIKDEEDNLPEADKIIHLSAQSAAIQALEEYNFSTVTLANNHMLDYGHEGLANTLDAFENSSITAVGAGRNAEETSTYSMDEYNGLNVATLGVNDITYSAMEQPGLASPGVLTSDPEQFIPAIQNAQEEADLVVVHLHAGQEYDSSPTTRQQELAKAIADAGADIVVGHHPHVLQSVDVYNDTLIMYSMGNFIFDQGWTRTRDSAVAEYELMEDGTARIEFKPYRIFEAQPRPVEGLTEFVHRFRIFRQLTKDTTNEEAIVENDERLIFEVDHSHVLEDREQ